MYTDALEKIIPAFFSGKRLNYARWMTVYLQKLLNIGTESPEVKQALSRGGLGHHQFFFKLGASFFYPFILTCI